VRRLLRRALVTASRSFDRIGRALLQAGIGTVNLSDLKADIRESWANFYSADADVASGFQWWEQDVVDKFVQPSDRVLVIGSGTGRDTLAFLTLGCTVTGVEPSAAALAVARTALASRGMVATMVEGFFEDVALTGPFDVIVFSWFSYSYTPISARRVESLRKARRLLGPGGRIVVSCVTNPSPPQSRLVAVQRRVARILRTGWVMEEGDNVRLFHPDRSAFAYEHQFRPGEFDAEAAAANLSIVYRNREDWVYVLSHASA
jgi:SAM-dependent methyltransferase